MATTWLSSRVDNLVGPGYQAVQTSNKFIAHLCSNFGLYLSAAAAAAALSTSLSSPKGAYFLDVKPLITLTSRTIASHVTGKTKGDIREALEIARRIELEREMETRALMQEQVLVKGSNPRTTLSHRLSQTTTSRTPANQCARTCALTRLRALTHSHAHAY